MYGTSITNGNDPILSGALYQLFEYSSTANLPAFRNSMVGFAAWNWLTLDADGNIGGAWNASNPIYQQAKKTIELTGHLGYYRSPSIY